ncbi:hypothetical protein CEE69_30050 [Rhodopirellula bahusiensis]|uniref:Uncharacterized protein n=2 Tax=Rhodopirellula bahusiensis TaxID=2014065 RepID=A0A2G1VXT8_9BACT|nr:hypothetical protein CEE69_30050 [Rhodopirellula bahusiensis]
MEVERDVDTLVVAMNAIVGLVDSEDVDAAHAILRASRRLGGWIVGPVELDAASSDGSRAGRREG